MKRVLSLLALSALSLAVAMPAAAQRGSVSLTWTQCDPVVQNLDFTAPGQVANLILTATGAEDMHKGWRFRVLVGENLTDPLPNAWRFDADGCNVGQLSLNTAALNKACPGWQGTNPLPIFNFGHEADKPNTATLDMLNAYDTADPVAGTIYTVWQALFNHTFSDVGPQDPALACGNAETQICFWLFYTEFLQPDLTFGPFDSIGNDYVTWNDPGNTNGCPNVQNQNSTWGRVKGLYR